MIFYTLYFIILFPIMFYFNIKSSYMGARTRATRGLQQG